MGLPSSTPLPSLISLFLFPVSQYKINITNNISTNNYRGSHSQDEKKEICVFPVKFVFSPVLDELKLNFPNDCRTSDIYQNNNNTSNDISNFDSHCLFNYEKDFRSKVSNKCDNTNSKKNLKSSLNCMMGKNNTYMIPTPNPNPNLHPHNEIHSHPHSYTHPYLESGTVTNTPRGNLDNNSSKSVNNIKTKMNKLTVVTENKFLSSENNSVAFKEFDQLCSRTIGPSIEVNIPQNENFNIHKNSNIALISNDTSRDRNSNQNYNSFSSEASKFLALLPDYTYLVS